LVSESVHKNILNKTDLESKFVREVNLKNVKEPVRVYQVMVAGSELGMADPKKKHGALSQLKSVSKKVIISIVAVITLLSLVYFFYTKPDGLETVPENVVEVTLIKATINWNHSWNAARKPLEAARPFTLLWFMPPRVKRNRPSSGWENPLKIMR